MIGDPDALVWTDRRTLRRARLVRAAGIALVLAVFAAAMTLAAVTIVLK
jgi:hypothetical protein